MKNNEPQGMAISMLAVFTDPLGLEIGIEAVVSGQDDGLSVPTEVLTKQELDKPSSWRSPVPATEIEAARQWLIDRIAQRAVEIFEEEDECETKEV